MQSRQRGVALVVSLVLVSAALMVGVSTMQSSRIEESASGNQRADASAFMAAEYGGAVALDTVNFAALAQGACSTGAGNVGNSQAAVTYRYEACKSSGGGITTVEAQGNAGGVIRTVMIDHILPAGFLGLSPVNLPTPLASFHAANSNVFVVEGQTSGGSDGGHLPAISTQGEKSEVEAAIGEGRLDNYQGGVADAVSESILQDPGAFQDFVDEVKSVADATGRAFATPGDVDTYGTTSLDGTPETRLTYIEGDFTASGEWSGRGLLVVDGDFDVSGTPYYEGLVIVLGNDYRLSGAGGGGINGAMITAPMDTSGSPVTYEAANVTVSGGGDADYVYDGQALDDAFALLVGTPAEALWNATNDSTRDAYLRGWREGFD